MQEISRTTLRTNHIQAKPTVILSQDSRILKIFMEVSYFDLINCQCLLQETKPEALVSEEDRHKQQRQA